MSVCKLRVVHYVYSGYSLIYTTLRFWVDSWPDPTSPHHHKTGFLSFFLAMDWNANLRVPNFVSRPDNSLSFLYNYNYNDQFPAGMSILTIFLIFLMLLMSWKIYVHCVCVGIKFQVLSGFKSLSLTLIAIYISRNRPHARVSIQVYGRLNGFRFSQINEKLRSFYKKSCWIWLEN